MEIYLIRHTTPLIEKGICYGQSDIGLSPSFEGEWEVIKKQLPLSVDALYSSPLQRCRQLGSKISGFYHLPLIEEARLMELHFGDWEMKKWEEINQQMLHGWMNNYTTQKCPNGESYADLLFRTKIFLQELSESAYSRVLLITHAGVIKSVATLLTMEESISMQVAYGGIYRYEMEK